MSAGDQELSGPDLAQGIGPDDIPEDGRLLGHSGGEAVLLVRRGEEIFAIGATCTHYGGPLAEGLVVGDTVRCPWHHACFSLRTGEALRAAGAQPVACWRGGARGRADRSSARRSSAMPAAADGVRRARSRSSSSAPARRATPRPRCCAARAIAGRDHR